MTTIADDVTAAHNLLTPNGESLPQVLGIEEGEGGEVTVDVSSFGKFMLYPDPSNYPGPMTVSSADGHFYDVFDGTIAVVIQKALGMCSARMDAREVSVSSSCVSSPLSPEPPTPELSKMENKLEEDMTEAKRRLGSDSVTAIEWCDRGYDGWRVLLTLQLKAIEGATAGSQLIAESSATAWGIHPDLPLILELYLPRSGYLTKSMEAKCVKSALQPGNDSFQLENQILEQLSGFVSFYLGHEREEAPMVDAAGSQIFNEKEMEIISEYEERKALMMSTAIADPSAGFLVHLLLYAQQRLATMHAFCALCDEPLGRAPMIMRTVCTRPLCSYQLVEVGDKMFRRWCEPVAPSASDDMLSGDEISELLFVLFEQACLTTSEAQKRMVLDPYPIVRNVAGDHLFMTVQGAVMTRDYDALAATVREVAHMRRQAREHMPGAVWTTMMPLMNFASASLMQWLVATNRSFIVPLREHQRLPEFGTQFQYVMISSPPEKEAKFQGLKEQYGSMFAFHGSKIGNWHSILRSGLKNASNTPMMSNGATYGSGIYMARASPVSLGFSGIRVGRRSGGAPDQPRLDREVTGNRCIRKNAAILAVCEVARHPSVKEHRNYESPFYVAADEDTVVTRFLLVYNNQGQDLDLEGELVNKIRQLMQSLHVGGT